MSVLKIHMTYQCTAACDHCRFKCTTDSAPVIDFDMAMRCVTELKKLNNLELVVLLGGEPGLFPELTHALTKAIRDLDITVRIETNASYAVSEDHAYNFLHPLYELGASVMFSLDAFHEPFIPLSRIRNALHVSHDIGGDYCLEMPYLDVSKCEHPLDQRTDALLAELKQQLPHCVPPKIYQGNLFFNGRAAAKISPIVSAGRGLPEDTCMAVPWWLHGELDTLELLILDAEGFLSKGCGIAIANINDTPVSQILRTFDARQHPIFSVLMETGPRGFLVEAQSLGYTRKADYADKCHLCQEVREVLQCRYPEYLVPGQHFA
jgi:hypothetical protein